METRRALSALALTMMTAVVLPDVIAQRPGTPDEAIIPPERPQKSRSDAHRVVGKVLRIDAEHGQVALATEEGEVVVKPPPQLLRAVRVGDTISVARSASEVTPSASPRTSPPSAVPRR